MTAHHDHSSDEGEDRLAEHSHAHGDEPVGEGHEPKDQPRLPFAHVHGAALAKWKRETRVGIAAVLSFAIVVSVLIMNKKGQKGATKDDRKGTPVMTIAAADSGTPPAAGEKKDPPKESPPAPAEPAPGPPAALPPAEATSKDDAAKPNATGGESVSLPPPASEPPPAAAPGPSEGAPNASATDTSLLPPPASEEVPKNNPQPPAPVEGARAQDPPAAAPAPPQPAPVGQDLPGPAEVPLQNPPAGNEPPPAAASQEPAPVLAPNEPAPAPPPAAAPPPTSASTNEPPAPPASAPAPANEPSPLPPAAAPSNEPPAPAPAMAPANEPPAPAPKVAPAPIAEAAPPESKPADVPNFTATPTTPEPPADAPAAGAGKLIPLPSLSRSQLGADDAGQPSVAAADAPAATAPRPGDGGGQVEVVPHTVVSGENFWTISRLYYGSGRYYKALWKANSQSVTAPEKLVVGTTIRIPPPEALDRSLILPPQAPRTGATATTRRTSRNNSGDATVRRSSEVELALPVIDPFSRRARRPAASFDPAPDQPDPRSRAVHKVAPHETLRSIARDRLGDSRRVQELIDLNRDVIDDPNHLAPGQIIELPEDASTARRTR